jgi:hypothetical protein
MHSGLHGALTMLGFQLNSSTLSIAAKGILSSVKHHEDYLHDGRHTKTEGTLYKLIAPSQKLDPVRDSKGKDPRISFTLVAIILCTRYWKGTSYATCFTVIYHRPCTKSYCTT